MENLNLREKINKIKNELNLVKDGTLKVGKGGSVSVPYITLGNILNKVNPLLNKYGVCITINVECPEPYNGFLNLYAIIMDCNSDVSMELSYACKLDSGYDEGKTRDIWLWGGTMTYAQRYIYGMIFGISALDDEDEIVFNVEDEWFCKEALKPLMNTNDHMLIVSTLRNWFRGQLSKDTVKKILM